jgi:hypothetical protein
VVEGVKIHPLVQHNVSKRLRQLRHVLPTRTRVSGKETRC